MLLTVLELQQDDLTLLSNRSLYCILFDAAEQSFPFR